MNPTSETNADDLPRDAWLSAALHHAPDANAAPPAALTDAILRQARAAARSVGPTLGAPRSANPLAAFMAAAWRGLARPPVAAGFASVMVATVLGLMWWGQPIDPTPTRAPAPGASPSVLRPAPPEPARPSAASPAQDDAPTARASVEQGPEASPPRSAAASKSLRPPEKAAPPQATLQRAPAPREPQPFEEAAAPQAAAPSATDATPAAVPGKVLAAPNVADTMRLSENAAPRITSAAKARSSIGEAAPSTRPPALTALLASLASEPKRWGWQRDERIRPMNPGLQRWLEQLDAATAARWRDDAASTASPGPTLRLYRDGNLAATLQLSDEGIALAPASRATLPPAALAVLKQSLEDATR